MATHKTQNELGGPTRRSRSGSGKVRLQDVAQQAGVSTATVSRAFNEPEKVAPEVRERVFAAAKALNWIPNAAGKALASSRTHIVGALIPTLDNEIFARQVSGLQNVVSEQDFTLFLGCSNYNPDEGFRHLRAMLCKGIEALMIVGENYPPEAFAMLSAANVPYVLTYSFHRVSPHPFIGFDNCAAFQRIAEHLLALGHRRFAAIFQPRENNDRVAARLRGIDDALAGAGLALAPENVLIGESTMAFGEAGLIQLMSRHEDRRPTALVCGNDNIALGALGAAADMGIGVPEQCSISGFDDLTLSARFSPRLTTMRVDNYLIGQRAGEELLATLEGRQPRPHSFEIVPELLIRDSTGPANILA